MQQAISCVSDTVVLVSKGGYEPAAPGAPNHSLTLAEGRVPLAGPARVSLTAALQYRIAPASTGRGRWQIEIAAYYYALSDDGGREILAYHWHPNVEDVAYAHLHVGHGAVRRELLDRLQLSLGHNALRADLAAAHVPTGHIELRTVLRLAIEQFHVVPRPAHRADWATLLSA